MDASQNLTYNGLVIVGTCIKCGFLIWGKGGSQTEHAYCGISPAKKPV